MHLAAGTDLPTALAAVQRDEPQPRKPGSALWVVALVIAGLVAWLLLK